MESNFPSNSNKEQREPKKKVEKVVTGAVIQRKKPLGRRLREFFFNGEDTKVVFLHVVNDVLRPGARDMIFDAGNQMLQRMTYGEVQPIRNRGAIIGGMFGNATYNAYNKYSSGTSLRPDPRGPGPSSIGRRGRAQNKDIQDIILSSRAEATDVIDQMYEIISAYGFVSVSDLFEMLGVHGEFPSESWGWSDIRGADVQRVPEGYLLVLPKLEALER